MYSVSEGDWFSMLPMPSPLHHNSYCLEYIYIMPGKQVKGACHILTQTKKEGQNPFPGLTLTLALTVKLGANYLATSNC